MYCINRNIVECKDCKQQIVACGKSVLIETLWNVKTPKAVKMQIFVFVLIETLWNVKILAKVVNQEELGINRNIVECKVELRF